MEESFIVQIFLDMPGIVVCYQLQALQGCYQGLIHTSPKPNINNKMIGHDYWVLTVSWHCFKYFTWINSFTSLSMPMRQRYFYFHFRDGNTEVGKRGSNLLRVTQQLRSGAQISLAGQAALLQVWVRGPLNSTNQPLELEQDVQHTTGLQDCGHSDALSPWC